MDILTYRLQAGLTLAEMAERLDVSLPAVSRWERGLGAPRMKTMEKIIDFTQGMVRPEDFLPRNQVPRDKLFPNGKPKFRRKVPRLSVHLTQDAE